MAKEKFTVLFDIQDQGSMPEPTWAEGTIETSGGAHNKNAGYKGSMASLPTPVDCKAVIVEAEGAEEAIQAVRQFYKQADGTSLAAKTSSLTEVT